jgi:uncharacterized membrane protein YdfJ with MMPL/SSD domain
MNSSDIALCLSALVNIALASFLTAHFRRRVREQVTTESKAKTAYSWLCVGVGVFSGFAVFLGATTLLNLPVGHGEVLIAAPLLNLLLAGVLIVAGRIVIGWEPVKW